MFGRIKGENITLELLIRCLPKEWLTPNALEASIAETRGTDNANAGVLKCLEMFFPFCFFPAFDATSTTGLTSSGSADRDLQSPTIHRLRNEFAKSFLQPRPADKQQ